MARFLLFFSILTLEATAALAGPPEAFEQYGNVYFRAAEGSVRQLTRNGNYGEPTLSPDGRTVAFVHEDTKASAVGESGLTSLWIADGLSGKFKKLLDPKPTGKHSRNPASFRHPVFSLNGGYVYIEAEASATSGAIYQVRVATGQVRYVVAGGLRGILRNGPYRGYLLVNQHRYFPGPQFGSYNPDFVIRPDGKEILRIPGTEIDDGRDRLPGWLKMKGWKL